MPFTIYILWMLGSIVGCYHFVTAVFTPDQGVTKLIVCMALWFVGLIGGIIVLLKFFPDKPRGTFRLNYVTLRYWGGMAQYLEVMDIADTHKDFVVPCGVNVFYGILEDTDDPVHGRGGSTMTCRPKWVRSLRNEEINSQTDLIKVEINKDGMPKVSYVGPEMLVTAECKWDFIPGEKK